MLSMQQKPRTLSEGLVMLKYLKNPCKEGNVCLVRAACTLSRSWKKTEKCPIYRKYEKIKNIKSEIIENILLVFNLTWFFAAIAWILIAFGWGSWNLASFLYDLIT
jgi:hypothetical protein